jgi:segregation and condensation protein A
VWNLLDAFAKVLARSKVKIEHEISFDQLSITERIQQLCDRLSERGRCAFDELFEGQATRFELIITFLAVLEMTRLRMTKLYQVDSLAPIHIELAATPAAGDPAPATPSDSPAAMANDPEPDGQAEETAGSKETA